MAGVSLMNLLCNYSDLMVVDLVLWVWIGRFLRHPRFCEIFFDTLTEIRGIVEYLF